MIRICTKTEIFRNAGDAFTYATSPSLWHEWHPVTHKVVGPKGSLTKGQTATETIHSVGRSFDATWTVQTHEAPNLWIIHTDNEHITCKITYKVSSLGANKCSFERTMVFQANQKPWRWLGPVFKAVLIPQSAKALKNLKAKLENQPVA